MSPEPSHRFSSYNIMAGGFARYDYGLQTPERLPLLQEAIRTINADVVGLVDTFRWDEIYTSENLQSLFGYPYAHVINLEDKRLKDLGHNNGIGLLSRLPVEESRTIWMENRNALLTSLRVGSNLVDVAVVYLDDVEESVRLNQMRSLVGQLDPRRPTILMGDFNTMGGEELTRIKQEVRKLTDPIARHFWPKLAKMREGQVLEYLATEGFVDGAVRKEATAPTLLTRPPLIPALFRLDYAFMRGRGRIRIANLHVVKTMTEKASDHYPVVFDVQVP